MDIQQAVAFNLTSSQFMVNGYLSDLTDAELLVRPVPGANHIAWQLGHLILAERIYVERVVPGSMSPLPEDFAERHAKDQAASDLPTDFLTKDEYLRLAGQVRADTLRVVASMAPGDFDKAPGPGPPFIKTSGEALLFIASHWVMHAGQWAIVRRAIGRPPLF